MAVIGFRNLSGRAESAWLSTAFAEMLTTELAAAQRLRTIPGEDVARMKVELELSDSESYAKDTLAKIHKNLGTDLVVLGSYLAIPGTGSVRLDLRLHTPSRRDARVVHGCGTKADLLELIARTARNAPRAGRAELSAARPRASGVPAATPDAARLYTQGSRTALFDAPAARGCGARGGRRRGDPLAHSRSRRLVRWAMTRKRAMPPRPRSIAPPASGPPNVYG